MTQETQKTRRDSSDDHLLRRDAFYEALKTAKSNKEDSHLGKAELQHVLSTALQETDRSLRLRGSTTVTSQEDVESYVNNNAQKIEKLNFLTALLASEIYAHELKIYGKQRTIRKTCYAALFISVSALGAMGVAKTLGAERCADAFGLKSADWSDATTLGLAAAVLLGLIAAVLLLKTKMNNLSRHELITLGTLCDVPKKTTKAQLSIWDVHPLNIPKEIRGWFKKSDEVLPDGEDGHLKKPTKLPDDKDGHFEYNDYQLIKNYDKEKQLTAIIDSIPKSDDGDDIIILVDDEKENYQDTAPTPQNYNPGGS